MKNWKTKQLKKLASTFVSIKSENDMMSFLRDLCTLEELEEMSRRWEAVEMIDKGITYREISEKTGLSTTTVTRIAHWLNNGEGGYRQALQNR